MTGIPVDGANGDRSTAESRRELTDEQEQAVTRRGGSLLLAAGAGSGKTAVLVERFVRAVCEDRVAPGRILAITFTERAAGELRERVRARLLELGERDSAREAEAAFLSTFHGFCARLLRAHPLQAGVEPGFEILEEGFAGRLRALAFSEALAGFLDGERAEAVDLSAAYGADQLCSMVLGAYAQLRSQGQDEPRLPPPRATRQESDESDARADAGLPSGEEALRACALIDELLGRFGVAYAQRKRERGALDFDDLELNARGLLQRRADVRGAWAERFEMLMVDEFQDTNPRQLQILAALDRDNLFTVGDQLQSIYSFRYADVNLFRERHARLSEQGASLALTRNFRSRAAILAAVERIFAQRMGERFAALAAGRVEDGTATSGASEQPHPARDVSTEPLVELLLTDKRGWESMPPDETLEGLPDATLWRQAEARLLARRLAELVANGEARAGEIVVLLRALGDLPVYEAALRDRGLRTLAGVGGFWGHQQVGDLLAWLRALANPLDEQALYSTLASPLVGVSSDGLALIARATREGRGGVWQTVKDRGGELEQLLPDADRVSLQAFRELFAAERAAIALHPIPRLLRRVILATGYEAYVSSLGWGERRLANVHKLVRLARRFETREGRDLRGFLDHVAHVELAREADATVGDGELDAVRLMSIHAAKGLEFPVVCVADLGREPNLRMPDLLVDGIAESVGLRLRGLSDPEPVAALDYDELCERRRGAQEEEEDRVLYVACTRAENRLLLSGAVKFARWPASKPGVAPIAWLAPALVPDAPTLAASADAGSPNSDGHPEGPTQRAHDERASERSPSGASSVDVDTGGGLLVRCVLNTPDRVEHTTPGIAVVQSVEERSPQPKAIPVVRASAPTPVPLADPDATMSYTSLAELERCGYRYYVERILRFPENHAAARAGESDEDDGGIEARVRGTIVHRLLESIDFTRPLPPSSQDVALVARRLGASIGAAAREEIAMLIATALAAEPAQRLRAARGARSEHPFCFSLAPEEPLITGVLDLIVEQSIGASLIVDYKSDRLAGGENLEELVRRDYGFQRLLYALAAIEGGAREVEVAHWFLERPAAWVAARFVADERDHLREQLLDRVARIRDRGFAVTETPHRKICLTCPARGGLCSWGETHTMSARSATLEFDVGGGTLDS